MFDTLRALSSGFAGALALHNLGWALVGTTLGTAIGVLRVDFAKSRCIKIATDTGEVKGGTASAGNVVKTFNVWDRSGAGTRQQEQQLMR